MTRQKPEPKYRRPRLLAKTCLECEQKFTPKFGEEWHTYCSYACWSKYKHRAASTPPERSVSPAVAYLEQRGQRLQQEATTFGRSATQHDVVQAMHRALATARL